MNPGIIALILLVLGLTFMSVGFSLNPSPGRRKLPAFFFVAGCIAIFAVGLIPFVYSIEQKSERSARITMVQKLLKGEIVTLEEFRDISVLHETARHKFGMSEGEITRWLKPTNVSIRLMAVPRPEVATNK